MSLVQRYFSWVILGVVGLAFIWPEPGSLFKPYLTPILMGMMVLSCLKIDFRELKQVPSNLWRYILVLGFIFIIPTGIVFLFKPVLEGEIFAGLILVTAVPSAVSVVFMSDLLGGEPTKALVATTLAHVVSPFLTPFLVWMATKETVQVEFLSMMILIGKLIVLPLAAAQILRILGWHKFLIKPAAPLNILLLLVLLWAIIGPAKNLMVEQWHQSLIVAGVCALIISLGVGLNIWFGRNKKEDITWAVVGLYKNLGLSSVIAVTMFGPLAVLGSVVYTVVGNFAMVALQWWANTGITVLPKKYKKEN